MGHGSRAALLSLTLLGCATPREAPTVGAREDPFAVVAEVERLVGPGLWPGFDPVSVPVAIFDGERTLLFRHPAPPAGFDPLPGREGVWVHPGRHPAVSANTSVDLGAVTTATLMPAAAGASLADRAQLLIHEAFHVFQRANHPGWSANEVELFTYPVDDPGLLLLRRMESEALRRGLVAPIDATAACWTRTALDLRRQRMARLGPGAAEYERKTELTEGLATYVERSAGGGAVDGLIPVEGFAPEAVRQRAYRSGTALAMLLDRFSGAAWQATLEQSDSTALEKLLLDALPTQGDAAPPCGFQPGERERLRARALADVRAVGAGRAEQRRAYLDAPGWTVIVESEAPLFPQGFDPLNVQILSEGEVLHTRFLRLGNDRGTLEILGRSALTESAGEHPLFNGVRRVVLTGFSAEPELTRTGDTLRLDPDGLVLEMSGATVEREGRVIVVRVGG